MPVSRILLLRHGHRLAWTLDPRTGSYTSSVPFPSKLPADPPLASHGVRQAEETASYLVNNTNDDYDNLPPNLLRVASEQSLLIYSSLFYRCPETLRPVVDALNKALQDTKTQLLKVRGEPGLGEWFGRAPFEQPPPGSAQMLSEKFFPWLDSSYKPLLVPARHGETIIDLHRRIQKTFDLIISAVDQEFPDKHMTVLICGHAAPIICSARALTGNTPQDLNEDDFKCYTCGISEFKRTSIEATTGVWDCVHNSWTGHLTEGAERGWHFHGDESFDSYGSTGPIELKTSDGIVREKKVVRDSNETKSQL